MGKRALVAVLLATLAALPGCYRTVGPVVTSVRLDKSGGLHYTRCNLVVSTMWINGDDDYENCTTESGDTVDAPLPLHSKAKTN